MPCRSAPWSWSSPTASPWPGRRGARPVRAKGYALVAMDLRTIDGDLADQHYAEHAERASTRRCASSSPAARWSPLVLEGDEAIEVVRALIGATDGRKAAPGTIRGDLVAVEPREPGPRLRLAESADREIGSSSRLCPESGEPFGPRPRLVTGRIRCVRGRRCIRDRAARRRCAARPRSTRSALQTG